MSVMDQYVASFVASASSWLHSMDFAAIEGESLFLQFVGKWAYSAYLERHFILMYIHMVLSAMLPIYIGCHASLRCPPSASQTTKKKIVSISSYDDNDDDEDDYEAEIDEFRGQGPHDGLTPFDAAMIPIFASLALGSLYLLIKWLSDLTLLNKILGYYMSLAGIFSVGNLAGDALNVLTTFIFPSIWSAKGKLYHVDPLLSQQFTLDPIAQGPNQDTLHKNLTGKTTPLPGLLSKISIPGKLNRLLWVARGLFRKHWIFRGSVTGLMAFKSKVRLSSLIGPIIGFAVVAVYNIGGKHWLMANLIGIGFCYSSIQMISPTTFWTGTLALTGLFVYDIVMVFYTPLMITVASSLKIPAMLTFPGPNRGMMIGLGDIALPGIMIALALRFDLYVYYLRKPAPLPTADSITSSKPVYRPASGRWGERYWTAGLPDSKMPSDIAATVFPKVYFTASLVGYFIGMVLTIIMLKIYRRGQPALLYLAPGILIALWGTALFRGEVKLMWSYTEAEEEAKDGKEVQNGSAEKDAKSSIPAEIDGKPEESAKKGEKKLGLDSKLALMYFILSEPRAPKSEAVLENNST